MGPCNIELGQCRVQHREIPRNIPSISAVVEGWAQCFREGRRFNATFTKRIGLHLQWQDADTAILDEMSTALGAEFLFVTPDAGDQTHGIRWGQDQQIELAISLFEAICEKYARFVGRNIRFVHPCFRVVDAPQEWFPPFELLHNN